MVTPTLQKGPISTEDRLLFQIINYLPNLHYGLTFIQAMIQFIREITDLILPPRIKKNLRNYGESPANGFQNPFQSPASKPDSNFLSSVVERWMSNRPSAAPSDWEQLTERVAALERRMLQYQKSTPVVRIFPTKRTENPS